MGVGGGGVVATRDTEPYIAILHVNYKFQFHVQISYTRSI